MMTTWAAEVSHKWEKVGSESVSETPQVGVFRRPRDIWLYPVWMEQHRHDVWFRLSVHGRVKVYADCATAFVH